MTEFLDTVEVQKPRYDAVIVLPGYPFPQTKVPLGNTQGIVERVAGLPGKTHRSGLFIDTRLRDLAASLLVKKGEANVVVTTSSPIRNWMQESYARLMEEDIKESLGDQPNVKIIREEISSDTFTEVEEVARLARLKALKHIAIVTDAEHGKRVEQYIKGSGQFPTFEIRTMESILTDKKYVDPRVLAHLTNLVKRYLSSPYWQYWKLREWCLRTFDPTGELLTGFAQKTR